MKKVRIGGQAVIEGVMMKNGDQYAVAVRKPDKEIDVKTENYNPIGEKIKLLKIPVIRGIVNFIESLVIGVKTLTYSAGFYEDEEETEAADSKKIGDTETATDGKKTGDTETAADGKKIEDNEASGALSGFEIFMTVAFSLVFAILIFMMLPAFLAELLSKVIKVHFVIALFEGILRMAIFLLYVILISRMEDIKRVFMYHGAEHKTINCLESGYELTVENVRKASRYHRRCGTSFIFIVLIITIVVFMFINFEVMWQRLLCRLLLIPVIAGISYEFIMYAGRSDSAFARALSAPGLWVQRLTTKEPEDDMIEVAIKSVEAVLDWQKYLEDLKNDESPD